MFSWHIGFRVEQSDIGFDFDQITQGNVPSVLRNVGRALLACCLVVSLLACTRRDADADDPTLGSRPPERNETHATFTFAGIPKADYMALYNSTGNIQCIEQAQISTFCEGYSIQREAA